MVVAAVAPAERPGEKESAGAKRQQQQQRELREERIEFWRQNSNRARRVGG